MHPALPRFLVAALIWAISAALPAFAQTRLNIPESRSLVARLLADGHYSAAHAVTSALMTRPDPTAGDRLLHARALRGIDQPRTAHRLALQVFRRADSQKLRYASAMVVAQALSSDGHKTRAQIWLRRAAEIAPDGARRAQAVQDFRYVRTTNPWSVRVRFGVSPSSNVNRGPTDNTFTWNGLTFVDPALVPLRGYEISTGLAIEHRLPLASGNRLRLGLVVDDSRFILSDEARRKVPGARGSDYDFLAVETRLAVDWLAPALSSTQTASLVFGRNWAGGQHLTDYLRAGLATSRAVTQKDRIGLRFSAERQWRQDAAIRSGDILTLGGSWGRVLADGAQLSLDLALSDMDAVSADIAHQKARLGVSYALGKPVLGALASLSLGVETRWYDRPLYGPEPRQDETLQIGGSLFFTTFDLFGFAPKVGLTATRTNSNVSRFETEAIELNLGLQSVF